MTDQLPPEVRRFINKHLHSVTQLELLLYLRDQHATEPVTPAIAAREHRLAEEQAAGLLLDLHARGLLVVVGGKGPASYRYQPRTRELTRQVEALAQVYPTYRHTVIDLIFSKPSENVMNFAQAFVLRKEEEKDGG